MKRDLKSANMNFEIMKDVVDDCLTNIKKVSQKVQKWLSWGILKLTVKKLHFEKNNLKIYEPDFWDF